MYPTSGLLTYLGHRFGALGLSIVVVLALAAVVAAGLVLLTFGELLAAGPDPVQVSPVRWFRRC